MLAAHCVWVTDEDIELFARRGVTVLHNPISNLKLASGIAPVARMLKAGCRITLGTDGVASNNNLNLWEEIKLMPMLQRAIRWTPRWYLPRRPSRRRPARARRPWNMRISACSGPAILRT